MCASASLVLVCVSSTLLNMECTSTSCSFTSRARSANISFTCTMPALIFFISTSRSSIISCMTVSSSTGTNFCIIMVSRIVRSTNRPLSVSSTLSTFGLVLNTAELNVAAVPRLTPLEDATLSPTLVLPDFAASLPILLPIAPPFRPRALSIAFSSLITSLRSFFTTAGEVVCGALHFCCSVPIWSSEESTSRMFLFTEATSCVIWSLMAAEGACFIIASMRTRVVWMLASPDWIFSTAAGISVLRIPTSRRITRVQRRRRALLKSALLVRGSRPSTLKRAMRDAYSHPSSSVNPVFLSNIHSETHFHSLLGRVISSLGIQGAR
mmetsp:Transcript_29121/g.64653  ORF Transcript_29121/g.64653 Transcript_29121/m.64653 type:complete len:324 (+) Transcript_29121:1042-2013(+)